MSLACFIIDDHFPVFQAVFFLFWFLVVFCGVLLLQNFFLIVYERSLKLKIQLRVLCRFVLNYCCE